MEVQLRLSTCLTAFLLDNSSSFQTTAITWQQQPFFPAGHILSHSAARILGVTIILNDRFHFIFDSFSIGGPTKCSETNNMFLNNYWMRLSMISWIIKTKVCVICQSRRLRQITQTRCFDNSGYHAKNKFNINCFIIHFSHNSSSETEAKRSAILFLRRTLQGA